MRRGVGARRPNRKTIEQKTTLLATTFMSDN